MVHYLTKYRHILDLMDGLRLCDSTRSLPDLDETRSGSDINHTLWRSAEDYSERVEYSAGTTDGVMAWPLFGPCKRVNSTELCLESSAENHLGAYHQPTLKLSASLLFSYYKFRYMHYTCDMRKHSFTSHGGTSSNGCLSIWSFW